VTGHVLYHVAHPNSKGPTNLAVEENWVVHTYWSDRHLRTEMSVLELWEDHDETEDVATVMLRGLGFGEGKKQATNKFIKGNTSHLGKLRRAAVKCSQRLTEAKK